MNTRIFSKYVQNIIRENNIEVVVGTFVVPAPKARRLIFDLFDDNVAYWRDYGRGLGYADEIEQIEKMYLDKADAVITASSVLMDKAHRLTARGPIYHIPNGVDLTKYVDIDGKSVRERLGVKGTLIGAIGNHDKLVELEKIIRLAEIFIREDILFWVAGRGAAIPTAREIAHQKGLVNIVFTGYISPSEVPEAVTALDVGLCPYNKTPGAEASCPMRLLIYSAAGIPVVCTDLEEVRRMNFSNVVLVSDEIDALAEGMRHAIKLPRAQPLQIMDYDIHYLVNKIEAIL